MMQCLAKPYYVNAVIIDYYLIALSALQYNIE